VSSTTQREITRNSSCFRKTDISLKSVLDQNLEVNVDSNFNIPVVQQVEPTGQVVDVVPARDTELVRREPSSRVGRGQISRLQVDGSKKSYTSVIN
jgi:hypothetical protein